MRVWRFLQGDAKFDIDAPAAYEDLLNDETQQFLSLLEVEVVDGGANHRREPGDPFAQCVLLSKFLALGGQGAALVLDAPCTILELLASAQ